jgi:PEP-CTERM motif
MIFEQPGGLQRMAAFRLGLKQTKWQFNTNYYEFILKLCLIRNREQSPWSTPPILTPTNYSGAPETISNAGFTLSPTLIPLDSLNFNDYPPTGQSDSPFTAAPDLDGVLNSPPVPEPSTWALMLAGFASLGYAAHRALRKRRALAAQC